MGFYGNITNTSKTQFNFDAIFPSRVDLENSFLNGQQTDIYIGRYALVEYSSDTTYDQFKKVYPGTNGNWFTEENHNNADNLKYILGKDIEEDEVVVNPTTSPQTFYKCVINEKGNYELKEYTQDPYTVNYNKDFAQYKNTRGYDSTVWQKTFVNGSNKWVMIAELNTVVPTFDLSIDAPTMNPITPHFDINSTNVYYQLHWQPQWGFRVAEAEDESHSDVYTTWISSSYDKATDELIEEIRESVPAAIYFNAAAFEEYSTTNKDVIGDNYISILPTGESGMEYNAHNGDRVSKETKKDIQEMRINLPIIGNVISKVWDIIHGSNRDDSTIDSLQGRLDFFTEEIEANEIPIQSTEGGYLVGTKINGNTKDATENILAATLSESFTSDDPWIRTDINVAFDLNNPEYHQNAISIHHTWHPTEDETSVSDMNEGKDTIELYTPLIDAAGHIVGKNTETVTLPYGYKTITSLGKAPLGYPLYTKDDTVMTYIYTAASNTQDSLDISPFNKWIQIAVRDNQVAIAHELISTDFGEKKSNSQELTPAFGSTFNIPVLTVDDAGHLTAFDTESVKIPDLIYTPDENESNDILLALSYTYDENTDVGTFKETRGHVDNLTIKDYNIGSAIAEKLSNADSIHGAFEKLQAQINALDYTFTANTGSYISSITETDGKIEVDETALPDYTDSGYASNKFVSKVTQDKGAITVEHGDFSPSVSIGAGTGDTTPTIKINVGGNESESQPINKASASVYGATRLTNSYSSEGTSYAITGAGVARALETLDVAGESSIAASKTISAWSEVDGKVSISTQDISIKDGNVAIGANIAMSKIDGLTKALNDITGTNTDTADQLTLYGLKTYIVSLQNTIATLTTRIEALEGTTPPTETV